MAQAFVIRPFGEKQDSSGVVIDFDRVHAELIGPALEAAGFGGGTTGQIVDSGNIRDDMFALILEADLIICDITVHNANVFYELGIRHALRKKRTLMIKGDPTADKTPFDLLTDRYLAYDVEDPSAARTELIAAIEATKASDRPTDSPVFQLLPELPEAPSSVQVVPLDFREEVGRARAARSKGWLRILSDEVKDRRFRWDGLKLVAEAQWKVKDYDGARQSWEKVRGQYPADVDANFALANIYERLYREQGRPDLIQRSDDAIARVLDAKRITRNQRAEALALRGRNQKTRWRLRFENLETVDDRRKSALNPDLIESYKSYREAFFQDLNHFYPGLAALQMGSLLVDLSELDDWYDAFTNDREADNYKDTVRAEVQGFRAMVPASLDAELTRLECDDPDRMWAEISAADVCFLEGERESRVIKAYLHAVPFDDPFAWDAAKGQLELFASLGFNADLAEHVIAEIEPHIEEKKTEKPVHLIVLAGHQIDSPGRPEPRFPASQEQQAKKLLREKIEALLDDKDDVVGLASAAHGADILGHEVFSALGLPSIVCLPMPANDFGRLAFGELDAWRTRFLDLCRERKVLELSDTEGLPRWLHGSELNPWERGNRWVMEMAQSWGANRVTLIALWDGKPQGDAPGGTAQMVQLARDAGTVDVEILDSRELLGPT